MRTRQGGAVLYATLSFNIIVLVNCWKTYVDRDTVYGKIRGFEKEVLPGKNVQLYLGVPYAAKPIGELRFEYPEEPAPWDGILNTTELSPACWQSRTWYIKKHRPGKVDMSEDCLYLNIYVPATGRENIEVLLWIHGGSNEVGMGAMLSGEVLAAFGDIIVVTFNYRLSNLGFLNLEHEDFPGYFGLADQRAVMMWIKNNIHYFNGDPGKVTLAGHSAGGLDVSLHMLSNTTKGLFRHVIQMSGTSLAYWSKLNNKLKYKYRDEILRYLSKLHCNLPDIQEIKRCLRLITAEELTNTRVKRQHWLLIEHPITVDNKLILESPEDSYQRGGAQELPIMLGFVKDEGGLSAEQLYERNKTMDKTLLLSYLDIFRELTEEIDGFSRLVLHEYAYYPDPYNGTKLLKSFAEIEGDLAMVVPTLRTANYLYDQYSKANFSHIYLYSFEFTSPDAFDNIPWLAGVPHGRDLFYLFGQPLIGHELYDFKEDDKTMSRAIMEIWSSFVKHGYPSFKSQNVTRFESFNSTAQALIKIENYQPDGISIRTDYKHKQKEYDFWTDVIPTLAAAQSKLSAASSRAARDFDVLYTLFVLICVVCFC